MVVIPLNRSVISYLLFLNLIQSFFITLTIEKPDPEPAMRVHPIPRGLNNNTLIHHHHRRHHNPTREPGKNLRRLPHIFNRVLELPLRSEADVAVEEKPDFFRFVAETDGLCGGGGGGEMRAYMVEIYPGITKIVVRTNESTSLGLSLDELELDVWRFRLPESTRPELVTVDCVDGALIVTVPKLVSEEEEEDDDDGGGGFGQGMGSGRLVLVQ
ncbi:hypothetical protein EUTSA_v10021506mg [Eutrema salsugineum]|uniref:SHSP domain-containing protein n=1 Tax=Eutrema salsugineum TaxID=72664 RepID=V4LB18_EUTSA|nr:uncharacterized protein LOC18023179 [Eutrema salsugineum]ESQ47605.1 hypothetical protein EUTSA_v10021506mg [Eutrema salsugineum]